MSTKPEPGAQAPAAPGGQPPRSDNLLPDDGSADDGRFEVAEEVSLDQQSDTARRVGEAAGGAAADALAESLRDQSGSGKGQPPR